MARLSASADPDCREGWPPEVETKEERAEVRRHAQLGWTIATNLIEIVDRHRGRDIEFSSTVTYVLRDPKKPG